MGNVSIWVVVLLVLLSGVVAAVGDWLGRRLGKKRLRIGRLRPKHTAIVTTAVAGMLITLATIIVLSLVSEQVRIWLTEGTDVQRQLRETKGQLSTTQGDLEAGRRQLDSTNRQLNEQKTRLAEEQAKLSQASKEASEMRAEASELRKQVSSLTAQVSASAKNLEKLRTEYAGVEQNLRTARANINTFVEQQNELFVENNRLLEENEKLEKDIEQMTTKIVELNRQIADAQQAQQNATNSFNEERQRIEAERTKALNDLAQANNDLSTARRDLSLLQNDALRLSSNATRARMSPLIYNRGDELSRMAVRSGLSQPEARSFLLAVVEMAAREAEQRGAERSETTSAAGFVDLPGQNGMVTADAQFNQALNALVAKEDELLIVVRAVYNFFRGDTVAVDVDIVPNKVVYNEGDFIIETRIDGRLGIQGVTEALVGFMGSDLRQRAIRDGIVPAIGRQTEIGSISQEQIQQIVGDIVATGRTITVRFHAAQLTKAGDQLVLDIRLR